jgi:branched-chain amino acid transport system ATP-binding protein
MSAVTAMHDTALEVSDLRVAYGRKEVLYGVDVSVGRGEIVVVVGHNGAGKTTLLKTVAGLLPALSGSIRRDGLEVTKTSSARRVEGGLWYIPSERFVFGPLSVDDNLALGAISGPSSRAHRSSGHREKAARLEQVYDLFPQLARRGKQRAGSMSGGQQRMLSLGMALMAEPALFLLDEPSLGLAPGLVIEIMDVVRRLADTGLSVLLVEQNIRQALRVADRAYVMRSGRIVREAAAAELTDQANVWDLF